MARLWHDLWNMHYVAHINWLWLLLCKQLVSWMVPYTTAYDSSLHAPECSLWIPIAALSPQCCFQDSSQESCQSRAAWPHMQHSFTLNMVKYFCLVEEGGSSLFMGYRFSQEVMRETSPSCFLKVTPLEAVLKTTNTQTMALPAVRDGYSLSTA